MKKRLEDQLLELAFDPRQDSIPAEIEADPAAHMRLNEYRTMKSALGQLRDIPEHQLSTERLREALLHQGLKRRFQFPWQLTAYGSVACAVVVCAFFTSKVFRPVQQTPSSASPRNVVDVTPKLDSSDTANMWLTPPDANTHTPRGGVATAVHHHHAHLKLVTGHSTDSLVLNVKKLDPYVSTPPSRTLTSLYKPNSASEARDGDNQLPTKPVSPQGRFRMPSS